MLEVENVKFSTVKMALGTQRFVHFFLWKTLIFSVVIQNLLIATMMAIIRLKNTTWNVSNSLASNNDADITMTRNMLFMVGFYETLSILLLSIATPCHCIMANSKHFMVIKIDNNDSIICLKLVKWATKTIDVKIRE